MLALAFLVLAPAQGSSFSTDMSCGGSLTSAREIIVQAFRRAADSESIQDRVARIAQTRDWVLSEIEPILQELDRAKDEIARQQPGPPSLQRMHANSYFECVRLLLVTISKQFPVHHDEDALREGLTQDLRRVQSLRSAVRMASDDRNALRGLERLVTWSASFRMIQVLIDAEREGKPVAIEVALERVRQEYRWDPIIEMLLAMHSSKIKEAYVNSTDGRIASNPFYGGAFRAERVGGNRMRPSFF